MKHSASINILLKYTLTCEDLPYDPENSTPGQLPGEKHNSKKTHTLNAHSSAVYNSQDLGQPECPSPAGQIKKSWHMRIMGFYSATKRDKPGASAEMRADLETVTKVSQSEREECDIAYMRDPEKWYR